MYNNPYMYNYNNLNQQSINDRIDNQIAQLQQMKEQMKSASQPTNINQTFQIAPTNHETIKYAENIDEVQREAVVGLTPYFSKNMSVVWLKSPKGDIKTYELTEIVPRDEKDMQIELLQSQIDALREEISRNDANVTNVVSTEDATDTTRISETTGIEPKESKSTSVSKLQSSKKR